MSTVLPLLLLLAIVVAVNVAAVFLTPKGPQQVLIRTMVMLTVTSCYLLWAITYLAQLHPLIAPHRMILAE